MSDAGEYVRGGSSMGGMGRGRGIGSQVYEQVSDTVGGLAHGVRRGAEQGVDMVKDSGYGISSKLGSDTRCSVAVSCGGSARLSAGEKALS